MKLHISTLSLSIRNCKSAGFLSSVLQGSQSIIYGRNYIAAIQIINSKDAALFFYSSHLISSDRILLSDFNFTFKTRWHCFLMFGGFQNQIIIIETNLSTYPFLPYLKNFSEFFKKVLDICFHFVYSTAHKAKALWKDLQRSHPGRLFRFIKLSFHRKCSMRNFLWDENRRQSQWWSVAALHIFRKYCKPKGEYLYGTEYPWTVRQPGLQRQSNEK
mgnify:CR=1 FL=1